MEGASLRALLEGNKRPILVGVTVSALQAKRQKH